eukprot:967724-Amphidinium_carterae.1
MELVSDSSESSRLDDGLLDSMQSVPIHRQLMHHTHMRANDKYACWKKAQMSYVHGTVMYQRSRIESDDYPSSRSCMSPAQSLASE